MKLIIEIKNEEELRERIEELKVLKGLGLDYELFWAIVHNLHNGVTSRTRRNKFDVKGWVEFYHEYDVNIDENLMESFLGYLSKYYSYILKKEAKNEFRELLNDNISEEESPFGLETIALMSI